MTNSEPEVEVLFDFDGWFEAFIRNLINEKKSEGKPFKYKKIVVQAKPYHPYGCSYKEQDPDTLLLIFYSALRSGFGELSKDDIQGIKDLL